MANNSGMMYPIAGSAKSTAFHPVLGRYTQEGTAPISSLGVTLGQAEDMTEEQRKKTMIMCALTAAAALAVGWMIFK